MTKILQGGIGSGKSMALIQESARTGIYIMVANKVRAKILFDNAKRMGYDIPYPITIYEWLWSHNRFAGSSIQRDGIYIDDVDDVFEEIFRPLKINAVTMRPLDEEQIDEPMRWARMNPIIEKQKQIDDEIYANSMLAKFDSEFDLLKKIVEV